MPRPEKQAPNANAARLPEHPAGEGGVPSSSSPSTAATAEGLAAALAQIRIYSESARNALARRNQWIGYAVKCGATEAQIEEAKVTK
jgi:hypothetical protein